MTHTVVTTGVKLPAEHDCQPTRTDLPYASVLRCDACGWHWLWARGRWTRIGLRQAQLVTAGNQVALAAAEAEGVKVVRSS